MLRLETIPDVDPESGCGRSPPQPAVALGCDYLRGGALDCGVAWAACPWSSLSRFGWVGGGGGSGIFAPIRLQDRELTPPLSGDVA